MPLLLDNVGEGDGVCHSRQGQQSEYCAHFSSLAEKGGKPKQDIRYRFRVIKKKVVKRAFIVHITWWAFGLQSLNNNKHSSRADEIHKKWLTNNKYINQNNNKAAWVKYMFENW